MPDPPRRARRLVVRRPRRARRRHLERPRRARSSSVRRRAPSTPSSRSGRSRPAAGSGRHVHSFEEALYVLGGEIADRDRRPRPPPRQRRLRADERRAGARARRTRATGQVRWLSVSTPQRPPRTAGRTDTFFEPGPLDAGALLRRGPTRPRSATPTPRFVGHYDGTPPQAEALALPDEAKGRKAAGMDTALVVYSGISVKMLVDRVLGADLLTMFTVDYEPRRQRPGARPPVRGDVLLPRRRGRGGARRRRRTRSGPGDVVFAGVGSVHGFYNTGTERVRWIETQAPQPPARHSYRWLQTWEQFEAAAASGRVTGDHPRSPTPSRDRRTTDDQRWRRRRRGRHAGDRPRDRPPLRGGRRARS